ncbi:MAG: SPFH domain-containing protein [Endozoicomonas sp.]
MTNHCFYWLQRTAFVLVVFFFGNGAEAGFFPYRYTVPEDSVGIFKNHETFYQEVYPAGTYTAWPKDEAFIVSLKPTAKQIKNIPCTTIEGFNLFIPQVSIIYRTSYDTVLSLVLNHGVEYEENLIRKPLIKEVNHLCHQMTVESVYLTEFSTLSQRLKERVEQLQIEQNSGLLIDDIDLAHPGIPDEVLRDYLMPLLSATCQEPDDSFSIPEEERNARAHLCSDIPDDEVNALPQLAVTFEQLENSKTIVDVEPSKDLAGHDVSQLVPELDERERVEPIIVPDSTLIEEQALSNSQKKQKICKNRNGQLYLSW